MKELMEELKKDSCIETVMQFGSSLRNKSHSDIDICIFTETKLRFKDKLSIISRFPSRYDISFFDDLPLNIKKRVLSEGKIIFTKDYYKVLERIKRLDYEYPQYKKFLEEYHNKKMAGING